MAIWEDPTSFGFFQAVRLLERGLPGRAPVGGFGDPGAEAVRFAVATGVGFPASEIQEADPPADPDAPARMTVNFLGLTGPLGVLPLHYTVEVADRVRARDHAMRDFLDLFHHRAISLFYRAWEKYRFLIAREGGRADGLTTHLRDLVGLGTPGLQGRLPVPDEALLFYAGLLAPQARSAAGLEQLVGDWFGVPAQVEQFVGAWYALGADTLSRLDDPDAGAATQLGLGAVAGDEVWDRQARIRLRLGPLGRGRFDDFLPSGRAHEPLRALVRYYVDDELDVEVQLVLARDEVPGYILGDDAGASPPLAWTSWLRTRPMERDPDDAVFVL